MFKIIIGLAIGTAAAIAVSYNHYRRRGSRYAPGHR